MKNTVGRGSSEPDIVKRVRSCKDRAVMGSNGYLTHTGLLLHEAADEIERLRGALEIIGRKGSGFGPAGVIARAAFTPDAPKKAKPLE